VLWITGDFLPAVGGIQVYIDRLTDALTQKCRVALVTELGQLPPSNRAIPHFPIARLRAPLSEDDFTSTREHIAAIVSSLRPDIIHFSNAGIAVYRGAVPTSIPFVVTVHGNDLTAPWQSVPRAKPIDDIVSALNEADHIVSVSEHTRRSLALYNVSAPITVMRHGCNFDLFHPLHLDVAAIKKSARLPVNCTILLTVARFVPRKGHLVLLKAIQALDIPIHWIVVGAGRCFHQFVGEIQRSGMTPQITVFSHVSDQHLALLYNICDLFVLVPEEILSERGLDSEGFGLVFQEASACGKPVITSNVSGCKEAIVDGETGIMVPARDHRALANAIRRLVTDRAFAHQLGQRGASLMRAQGDWSRLAGEMYSLYTQLSGSSDAT
jgi:glycosyltransferase involved in cell wall biosynthesis